MTEQEVQALRTIDKFDKIGASGVVDLLQKPIEDFGAGLTRLQAEFIGLVISLKGQDNQETLSKLRCLFKPSHLLPARLNLIELLEEIPNEDHGDAMGYYLAMPSNDDQTWDNDGRPANIAWMLDDMAELITRILSKRSN